MSNSVANRLSPASAVPVKQSAANQAANQRFRVLVRGSEAARAHTAERRVVAWVGLLAVGEAYVAGRTQGLRGGGMERAHRVRGQRREGQWDRNNIMGARE